MSHAMTEIPAYLEKIRLPKQALTWVVITHPDGDHCGGTGKMAKRYPNLRIGCGTADQALVESPEHLWSFRYDRYRQDHGIFYDEKTAAFIRNSFSNPQPVSLTFSGGERLSLGQDRVLELWHAPGHTWLSTTANTARCFTVMPSKARDSSRCRVNGCSAPPICTWSPIFKLFDMDRRPRCRFDRGVPLAGMARSGGNQRILCRIKKLRNVGGTFN